MTSPMDGASGRVVIPPGQEDVVARMLALPAGQAGGWQLDHVAIRDDRITGYYRGPAAERARILLCARDGAPPKWGRTAQFAVGMAIDPPRPSGAVLYRAVLAAVAAAEGAFRWAPLDAGAASGRGQQRGPGHDPGAAAARAAERDIDRHLDLVPFIDLEVPFDHEGAFAEAMALADRFVPYQSDPRYGVSGWRGLALQALDGDATHVATTDADAGVYGDESRYRLTDVAARCPITMAFLERVLDFERSRTVAFLMLMPGARIVVHVDGVGPPVMRSLNAALNMPEGCRLVIDCNPDGSDNAYTRVAPFRAGHALLLNVAKYHYVVNDSPVPRIHVVARGTLRVPAPRILALAEAQHGMAGPAVEAALQEKRRALGAGAPVEGGASAAGREGERVPLTPFVGGLAAAARDRLLDLLDLGDGVRAATVGPVEPGARVWRGEIGLQLPSGATATLDIEAADAARPAWCRSARLACSYRAGSDPFADGRDAAVLTALRERLRRLDAAAAPSPAVTAFFEALQRYAPFLPVKDEDFRLVFRGAAQPVGILWLGFGCNQDCVLCWQGRDWPAPPDAMFDRWIEELCAAGLRHLIFSGGEPTVHPRLMHWLRQAAAAGAEVMLETNAIRFCEPDYLDELRAAGLGWAVVSLHAADPAVSDALTQTPGSFARTVEGTQAALAAGLKVGVHCVVEQANVEGLEAHARFVAGTLRSGDRRVAHVSYSFPIGYRRRERYAGAIVPIDQLRPRLSAARRILVEAGIDVRVLGSSGFTPCAVDDPAAALAVQPCAGADGSAVDRTFVDACASCACRPQCLGVHTTYVAAYGARGVTPIPAAPG